MSPPPRAHLARTGHASACALLLALVAACAGSPVASPPVRIVVTGPDVVSTWNEIAATTVNQPPDPTGTPAEQRPIHAVDLATVQIAVYDAVQAIARTHQPFAVTRLAAATEGASQEAAVGEAAYRVLRGLFPSRSTTYQPAHDRFIAALATGPAAERGLAVGAEVAAGVLAWRADDGRMVTLAPYVPGTGPGQFRGSNPILRALPAVRPFALTSNAQFRAPGPPSLGSAAYAADFDETRRLGGAGSTVRTAAQLETARFYSEAPFTYWPRNMRGLAMTRGSLADHARLLAMLWVTQADATDACFESKYHHDFWRPLSAIPLGDTDGNTATTADPAWVPVLPTPNHPEYPAAHSCVTAALAQTMRVYFGTSQIAFDFDSTVTGSTHHYDSVDALVDEVQLARIAGGMHFRSATVDGAALGRRVADWVLARHFQAR
jgi:PAP2 superfamily